MINFLLQGHNQLAQYKVFGHPMFLNDLEVLEVDSPSNAFTIIEKTLLQQRIKIYTLQANSKDEKVYKGAVAVEMG